MPGGMAALAALLAQQSHLLHAALGPWKVWPFKGSKCRKQTCSHLPNICSHLPNICSHLLNICSLAARGRWEPSPCISFSMCQGAHPQPSRAMGAPGAQRPNSFCLCESGPRVPRFSPTLWMFVLSPAAFAFIFCLHASACTSSSACSCSK